MNQIIKTLRQKLSKGYGELFGFLEEKNRLLKSIKNAYKDGISDSILIIGKKGTGKTHLIRTVLDELQLDEDFNTNMITIQLNGLIQVDDRMAIKSIAERVKVTFEDDNDQTFNSQRINDTLQHILRVMSSGTDSNISLLFIIEEFDLFLMNHNQMLIYNLVNGVQAARTPICVIGLTSRLDVVELMEKRVTSRFSRCHINLTTYTKDFDTYIATAKQLLTVENKDNTNKAIATKWNKHVDTFLEDTDVLKILERNYFMSNTISRLKLILIGVVCRLSENQTCLEVNDLKDSWKRISVDYKTEILKGLSEVEFTFIAIMVKCAEIKDGDINFEMVYKDYQTFCRNCHMTALENSSMKKCFDNLINLQLVGLKRVSSVSIGYQTLQCYVQLCDLRECLKSRKVLTQLQHFIQA